MAGGGCTRDTRQSRARAAPLTGVLPEPPLCRPAASSRHWWLGWAPPPCPAPAPRSPKTQRRAQQPRDTSLGRGPVSVARFGRPLRAVPRLWPCSNPLLQVPVNAAEPAEFCESEEPRWLRSSPPICYTMRGKSFTQQSLQDHSLSPGFAPPAPSPPTAPRSWTR